MLIYQIKSNIKGGEKINIIIYFLTLQITTLNPTLHSIPHTYKIYKKYKSYV